MRAVGEVAETALHDMSCLSVGAVVEHIRLDWARALEADPATQLSLGRVNCGVVLQNAYMRIVIGQVLAGRVLTKASAEQINSAMGVRFVPVMLPALAQVLQDYWRKDVQRSRVSVSVVEAAYHLTA